MSRARKHPGDRLAYLMCGSKTKFYTSRAAKEQANNVTAKRGTRLRVYACDMCGGFHMTSQIRSEAA